MQGHIWLAPPQLYELCRFAQIGTVEDLKIFCKSRQQKGIERWLPIRSQSEEGYTTILPGKFSELLLTCHGNITVWRNSVRTGMKIRQQKRIF